jgi:hypothetical protein
MIFISSTSVYGDSNDPTEETPLNPDSEGKQLAIVEDVFSTVVLKLLYFVLEV